MIKKFSTLMMLAFALIFIGAPANTAEAGSVYVGTYSDGTAGYLQTHTVNIQSYRPYRFTCTVYSAGVNLYYNFYSVNGSPYYRNSLGYQGYVYGGASPVASNIYNYVVNHW